MSIDLHLLKNALLSAWSAATSYDPAGWSQDNPAYGQCAVTACVVQDYLGGEIVWAEALLPDGEKVSHFFNVLNGTELDLTLGQFPHGTVVPKGIAYPGAVSTRAHILAYPATVARYDALKSRVVEAVRGMT